MLPYVPVYPPPLSIAGRMLWLTVACRCVREHVHCPPQRRLQSTVR